jgi:oxygen-independent coproporphyrinogen-3 oxidase
VPKTAGCYIHIPFCARKCAYCDFNSYSGYGEALVKRYVSALISEIQAEPNPPDKGVVDTIFFGGGTPTAIPATDEAALLNAAVKRLNVDTETAEITTEANPGSSDISGLSILREAGFNRISFGVQSFDNGLLQAIDRIHSASEAKAAIRAARSAGFNNISLDLMFGLPHQTLQQWVDTIDQAMELGTDHLSMYGLVVEENTGFGIQQRKGLLKLPDDDLVAEMYTLALSRAKSAGYEQYEISNFAKPGKQCRHNLHYWRADDWFGFGAGAVGMHGGVRQTKISLPARYAEAVEQGVSVIESREELLDKDLRGEAMMLGLRLTSDGVSTAEFSRRFGQTPAQIWPESIERFTRLGLLESTDHSDRVVLTERGVFMANDVMAEFI